MYLFCVLLWLSVAHGLRLAPGHGQPRVLARSRASMQETAEAAAADPELTKKAMRRQIMTKSSYMRGGAPFEKAIHKDVSGKMSEMFAGELVEQMKESSFRELSVGESHMVTRTPRSLPRYFTRARLLRAVSVRAGGTGQLAPAPPRTVRAPHAYQPRAYRALPWHPGRGGTPDGLTLTPSSTPTPTPTLIPGEGARQMTFVLAKEFGFCWGELRGARTLTFPEPEPQPKPLTLPPNPSPSPQPSPGVERSIELAWAARDQYPDKTMHITNELIHNPGVNELLQGMDIKFIEKDDSAMGKRLDTLTSALALNPNPHPHLSPNTLTTHRLPSPFTVTVTTHRSPLTTGGETHHSPLTTHHSPLTAHHSPLTTHHSPLTPHHSPLTAHRSPLTFHPHPHPHQASASTPSATATWSSSPPSAPRSKRCSTSMPRASPPSTPPARGSPR